MRESKIEKAYCQKLKDEGHWPIKLVAGGVTGLPDRIVLRQGGSVSFIEFKSANGSLSPRQSRVIGKLLAMGFEVEVINALP